MIELRENDRAPEPSDPWPLSRPVDPASMVDDGDISILPWYPFAHRQI